MEEKVNIIAQESALFQKNQLAINGDVFKQLEEQKHNLQLLLQDLSAFNKRITNLSERYNILNDKNTDLDKKLITHEHSRPLRTGWLWK